MGLAVKTDGAAVPSGAITQLLIYAKAAAVCRLPTDKGWMVGTTTTVKIFIDIPIGVWAFILAYIWTRHIEPRQNGDRLRTTEIWERSPPLWVCGHLPDRFCSSALASEAYLQALGQRPLRQAQISEDEHEGGHVAEHELRKPLPDLDGPHRLAGPAVDLVTSRSGPGRTTRRR